MPSASLKISEEYSTKEYSIVAAHTCIMEYAAVCKRGKGALEF